MKCGASPRAAAQIHLKGLQPKTFRDIGRLPGPLVGLNSRTVLVVLRMLHLNQIK